MKITELFNEKIQKSVLKRPYVIAEAGVNHEGSIEIAKRLILEAKEGGADAIKFQTYKASSLASKHSPAYWDTSKEPTLSQFELFSKHDKFWKNEMVILKDYCDEVDIEFLSTPFDFESAIFLNDLMSVFKISSSDITNKPFIDHICKFGKPIILSTGASHLYEIHEAVSWVESFGNPLALLHCVLNYPTDDNNANLGMILGLKKAFPDKIVGYSDHTMPKNMKTLEVATLLGSVILEKHFTHDKSLPGNDHYHAMDRDDLIQYRRAMDETFDLIGNFNVSALPSEILAVKNARRSIVAARNIAKGEMIKSEDLAYKRPAHGISPKFVESIVGRIAQENIQDDDLIKWSHVGL